MRKIGEIGDHATETEVLLIENDISMRPFSEQVLACFPPFPWTLQPKDLSNPQREDLRHLRVFSMDPRILMMHYAAERCQSQIFEAGV